MGVNRLVLSDEEEIIIDMLRATPRGVTIEDMAERIGQDRRGDITQMLRHLKALGLIRRKKTDYNHRVVWMLI